MSGWAGPARQRVLAQTSFEARAILRNGEQLLVTVIVPVLVLVGLATVTGIELDTGGATRIDFLTPGILALAVMTTSFTSQAIATSFDRRNGVLRLLSTTPLGRSGLLAGKVLAVFAVEAGAGRRHGGHRAALGLAPGPGGVACGGRVVLGTAAFTSLALLVAGTLRSEAVLAVANLLLVVLAVGGGVVVPPSQLPGPIAHAALLPRPVRSARGCGRL